MKILHVVPTYLPATRYGGPIFAVHGLAKALAARGHKVDVFTTNVDGPGVSDVRLSAPVDVEGVRVRYFASPFPRLYWSPAMKAALRTAAQRAEVVHAHSVFLWPTLAAARAAAAAERPFVLSPRGMLVPELIAAKSAFVKRSWIALFERRNLERASAVHFTSDIEQHDAERLGLRLRRALVIPNGIDLAEPVAVERHPRRILYLGRISWKKRIDLLIRAIAHAPSAELVIAGNDEEGLTPELRRLAIDTGVADRIDWREAVYGDAKQALLGSAAVFALTSDSENFGNTVLEALAQKTPVVLTPGVGVAAEVERGGAGLVGTSVEEIAALFERLLADAAGRREMGERGRAMVEERFGWARVAALMESAYESLIAR